MTMKMSQQTIDRLTQKLINDLHNHEHRDEIVALATEQLIDDQDQVTD